MRYENLKCAWHRTPIFFVVSIIMFLISPVLPSFNFIFIFIHAVRVLFHWPLFFHIFINTATNFISHWISQSFQVVAQWNFLFIVLHWFAVGVKNRYLSIWIVAISSILFSISILVCVTISITCACFSSFPLTLYVVDNLCFNVIFLSSPHSRCRDVVIFASFSKHVFVLVFVVVVTLRTFSEMSWHRHKHTYANVNDV